MGGSRLDFLVAVLALAGSFAACADVTLSRINEVSFPTNGCGGITRMGGDDYWVLCDHGPSEKSEIFPLTIKVNASSGKIESSSIGSGIALEGNTDSEGIVFDAATGGIWVSDEIGMSIREFMPVLAAKSVSPLREAPVPEIYRRNCASGRGLEALGLSPDGLTMWTANEEALTCDGERSSDTVATVVRLTRFIRANAYDNWTAAGQWAYKCEKADSSLVDSYKFCGVSGLCALPDGSLLVLERETSTTTCGRVQIYRLTANTFTAATDVSGIGALKETSYSALSKGTALITMKGGFLNYKNIIVYEGICLGPKLSDGSLSVLLVADGGEETTKTIGFISVTAKTVSRLCALKLSGIAAESPSADGIPLDWFARNGYTSNDPSKLASGARGDLYGYTVGDVYTAGLDPKSDEPLRITGISFKDGTVSLEFNAIRVAPGSTCHIEACRDLTEGFTEIMTGMNEFDEDRAAWRTTWRGSLPAGYDASGLFRIRISR